jgi:excisionase family DNA binding protein
MDELQSSQDIPSQRVRRRPRRSFGRPQDEHTEPPAPMPMLLTVDDAAELLRTTNRAIYAMVERRQLPGIIRIRRRVLFRTDDLLDWLDQKRRAIAEGVTAMSVTVRPYVNGGWEVDIRVQLPDGSVIRERKKASATSKLAAQKWAESRERVLLVHGKPKPVKEELQTIPTVKEFALRFLDGYAKANRLKPSGIASKETVLRVHLARAFGDKRLDEITTEDVQRLKATLTERAPKTVNNILTTLSVVLRTAVEWGVIEDVPCSIKLLRAPKTEASFHDFEEFERLVEVARSEASALLVVLLGGEAGLRCGEMMALEWTDVDLTKRQLTVARSEWKGHVTMPKGGRLRYVPLTRRLTDALREARHLRGPRVLCDGAGKPLTQKVVQVLVRQTARRANVKPGIHILRHSFCSHLAMRGAPARAIQELAGHQDLGTTQRYMHLSPAALDAAIRLLETGTEMGRAAVEK